MDRIIPGRTCLLCEEQVKDGDFAPSQAPMHKDCLIRTVVGGVNHQMGLCTCCGSDLLPDLPGLSKREAARVAATHWRRHSQVT